MKSYNQFRKIENKKILSSYYNIIRKTDFYLKYKLETNIVTYHKIFKSLFNNNDLDLDYYKLNLLIIISFVKISHGSEENILLLNNEIKEYGINNLTNISYNILKHIFKILLIKTKLTKDINILFNNREYIFLIKEYIIRNNMNSYEFNSLYHNNYIDILNEI